MRTFASISKKKASARPTHHLRPPAYGPGRSGQAGEIHRILGHSCIQPKLTVGAPNDVCEQDADRVADGVMRMPGEASARRPLEDGVRKHLEGMFGTDLGSVRVHDDTEAGLESVRQGAAAFAMGHDIYFAPNRYSPDTAAGRRLIAHEVVHTLQQARPRDTAVATSEHSEVEADFAAAQAGQDRRTFVTTSIPPSVQCNPLTEAEILARVAEIESILEDPVSCSPDELDALEFEYHELQRQYSQLHTPSEPASVPRPVPAEEPLTSEAEPSTWEEATLNEEGYPVCEESNPSEAAFPVCEMPPESAAQPAPSESVEMPPVAEGEALTCEMPLVDEAVLASEAQPVCEALPAVAPEDMVDMVITQRGFSTARPTPEGGISSPSMEPGPLGTGYQTNAVVQVLDADGNQVAFELAQYNGGGGEHAEEQAVANLAARLSGQRFPGGRLIAAVDQRACGGCMGLLRGLAQQLGLERVEVWGPRRISASGRPVSPKWTARTATSVPARPSANEPSGGRYRMQPELLQSETVTPVPEETIPPIEGFAEEPMPVPEAPPPETITPEAVHEIPPTEEVVPPEGGGTGSGWGGAALGLAPFAFGLLHSWAESRRMQEQVSQEGFAPVGPDRYADENIIMRFGHWMLDPFGGGMVPASQRFHMPTWRRHIRDMVAGRDQITVSWEVPNSDPMLRMFPDHVNVDYRRGADGRWEVVPGQSFPEHFTPPDLNIIINPDQPDSSVEFELACSAGMCA